QQLKARWTTEHWHQVWQRVVITCESERVHLHLAVAEVVFDERARRADLYNHDAWRNIHTATVRVKSVMEERRRVVAFVRHNNELFDRLLARSHHFYRRAYAGCTVRLDAAKCLFPIRQLFASCLDWVGNRVKSVDEQFGVRDARNERGNLLTHLYRIG